MREIYGSLRVKYGNEWEKTPRTTKDDIEECSEESLKDDRQINK